MFSPKTINIKYIETSVLVYFFRKLILKFTNYYYTSTVYQKNKLSQLKNWV